MLTCLNLTRESSEMNLITNWSINVEIFWNKIFSPRFWWYRWDFRHFTYDPSLFLDHMDARISQLFMVHVFCYKTYILCGFCVCVFFSFASYYLCLNTKKSYEEVVTVHALTDNVDYSNTLNSLFCLQVTLHKYASRLWCCASK